MLTFRQRWQSGTIRTLANERRILLLTGPRQCGKITLSKNLDLGKVEYRTLDNKTQREAAVLDPHSFLIHRGDMLIIDEVQRVASLLPAIKQVVDEDSRSGQFLLTGSAHVQALSSVQESLAGRIAKIRLRPLSEGEIREVAPRFLERAFVGDFNNGWVDCNRDRILATALRGGFPEVIDLAPRARRRWHRDYVGALLERDLRDAVQIRRRSAIRQLVEVLAGWSSKLINISSIGAKLSIQRATLESYINALEMLFIVERVPAWTKTDYSRVGRHSKLFMTDSGLMASILGWNADKITLSPDRLGKLFETFVCAEISSLIDANDGMYQLFHYRDREQREIDFIIEREDEVLLGIEVKASTTVGRGDFKHLRWFRDNIAGDRPFFGLVLYAGTYTGSMGKNLAVVPFGSLW